MDQFHPLNSISNLCYFHRNRILWRRFLQTITCDRAFTEPRAYQLQRRIIFYLNLLYHMTNDGDQTLGLTSA
jgi:hypothetical protein